MPQSANRRFLVAIETDATRYHGANAARPRLLAKNECEQMLAHLATDLGALLPGFNQCQLVAAGALFDQTQVLRPGYPVFGALENLSAQSSDPAMPKSFGLGAENGRIPVAALQPEPNIPLGLLQLLPVIVTGRADVIDDLGLAMEHRFIEEGQVSAHTARWLESAFAIKTSHARFMTLMDLNAMFRLQLEHFGFLPLWQILDAALNKLDGPLEVTLDSGQVFTWRDGAVHTVFQTFDHWSRLGGGKAMDSYRGKLAGGYADWTRVTRQFLTTLGAHNVPLKFSLPGQPQNTLSGTFFMEESAYRARTRCAEVTEHSFAELGTICVSVRRDGRLENYYPLASQGLNDIQNAIRERGLGEATIAFPGSILFDETTRSLVAESVSGRNRH